jgi:hypothetical protein
MQALVHAIMQLFFNICIIKRANYLESCRLLICIYIAYGYNHYSICNQYRVHNIPRYMQAILTCTFKLLLSIHLLVFLYCDIFGKIQICVIIIKFMYTVVTLSRKTSITYKTPALEIIGLRYIIILENSSFLLSYIHIINLTFYKENVPSSVMQRCYHFRKQWPTYIVELFACVYDSSSKKNTKYIAITCYIVHLILCKITDSIYKQQKNAICNGLIYIVVHGSRLKFVPDS